jgi:hypothetical protein
MCGPLGGGWGRESSPATFGLRRRGSVRAVEPLKETHGTRVLGAVVGARVEHVGPLKAFAANRRA